MEGSSNCNYDALVADIDEELTTLMEEFGKIYDGKSEEGGR